MSIFNTLRFKSAVSPAETQQRGLAQLRRSAAYLIVLTAINFLFAAGTPPAIKEGVTNREEAMR